MKVSTQEKNVKPERSLLMEQKHKKRMEEIMRTIECPYDFKCCKSGLTDLGKVKDFGCDLALESLDEKGCMCKFGTLFGRTFFCKCPLRIYIAKELKI